MGPDEITHDNGSVYTQQHKDSGLDALPVHEVRNEKLLQQSA